MTKSSAHPTAAPIGEEEPQRSFGSPSELLASTLERLGFLEWRLEQVEATERSAQLQLSQLRRELADESRARLQADRRALELEERLSQERNQTATLSERLARSERGYRELESSIGGSGGINQELGRELLLEQQRGEMQSRSLRAARDRVEVLERANARFFERLLQWQRSQPRDPEAVDLAEFIAELRAEILDLSRKEGARAEASARPERRSQPPSAQAAASTRPETPSTPASEPPSAPERPAPLVAAEAPAEASSPPAAQPADLSAAPHSAHSGFGPLPTPEPVGPAPSAPPTAPPRREGLLSELSAPRAWRRLAAGRELLSRFGVEALEPLSLALARAAAAEERIEWLKLLSLAPRPGGRAAVARYLQDGHHEVRVQALQSFLQLCGQEPDAESEALTALETALSDPDVRVRRRALSSSAQLPRSSVGTLLLSASRDEDSGIRRAACAALSHHRAPGVAPALKRAMKDAIPEVRRAAARALSTTQTPSESSHE